MAVAVGALSVVTVGGEHVPDAADSVRRLTVNSRLRASTSEMAEAGSAP